MSTVGTLLIAGAPGPFGERLSDELPGYQVIAKSVEESLGACEGVDAIFYLSTDADPSLLRKLLEAASAARVKRFVAASSTAVYGAWQTNPVPLTEDAPLRPNPGFSYAVEVAEHERVLAEWRALDLAPAVTVLRFSTIAGSGSNGLVFGALGNIDWHRHEESSRPVQFLHIDDAMSATAFAIKEHLTGGFNVSPRDFISESRALAIAGGPPRPGLPRRIAHFANDLTWRRRRFRSRFAAASDYFEHSWVVSSDRLRAAGWSPVFTSEEAIASETTPTFWNRLAPQQRRDFVNRSVVSSGFAIAGAVIGGISLLIARKRRA